MLAAGITAAASGGAHEPHRAVADEIIPLDANPPPAATPLKDWMEANFSAWRDMKPADLARTLQQVATFDPKQKGYETWAQIALDGAKSSCEAGHRPRQTI